MRPLREALVSDYRYIKPILLISARGDKEEVS
jgi:hypothetical protein